MAVSSIDIPVRFAETDAMGIVHHSNYVIWFEAGRVALMADAGIPYTVIAAGGNHFAVTSLQVDYRLPAHFGETVRLMTTVGALRSRQIVFHYALAGQDGRALATGSTEHMCVDLANRTARIPAPVAAVLQAFAER